MKSRKIDTWFSLLSLIVASSFASAQEAARITMTDEAAPIPGAYSIQPLTGAKVSSPDGPDATQMPGWPIVVGGNQTFAPTRGCVFADLNGDGPLEIIFSSTDNRLYAWDVTGTPMPGFPVALNNHAQTAPSVGDLDGDGDLEIVQFTRGFTDGGLLYVVDHLGQNVPGFPKSVNNNNFAGSPTLADLDDDGNLEILAPERAWPQGALHVFEADGSEWGGHWPTTLDHVPTGSPAVGDIDQDGAPEIAYLSYNSLYVWEIDGTLLSGWPQSIPNANFSYQSPAFADLDGDGDLEIVVGAHKDAAGYYVYHHTGARYPGWPQLVGTWTYAAPSVVDIDSDGSFEILGGREGTVSGPSNVAFAWQQNGIMRPGWPYSIIHGGLYGGGAAGPVTAADIDNDGFQEIFFDHSILFGDGFLFGVDHTGQDLPGFPLRPRGFTYQNGATIGDVDGDGDYELGVISYGGLDVDVNLYDLDELWSPSNVAWEGYHGGARRGGLEGGADKLHLQGFLRRGRTVQAYVVGNPGDKASLWVSLAIARQKVNPFGWLYLRQPVRVTVFDNLTIPASGEVVAPISVPNKAKFAGLRVYLQGLVTSGGQGAFTNLLGRTIQ